MKRMFHPGHYVAHPVRSKRTNSTLEKLLQALPFPSEISAAPTQSAEVARVQTERGVSNLFRRRCAGVIRRAS